jgi:hypothetical protein
MGQKIQNYDGLGLENRHFLLFSAVADITIKFLGAVGDRVKKF